MEDPSHADAVMRGIDVVAAQFTCNDPAQLATLAELIAAALARELRATGAPAAAPNHSANVLTVGALTIDLACHEARLNGELLQLKPQEFSILTVLARHPGQVFTRSQLLDLAWPTDASLEVTDRSVDVHVSRLRRSMGCANTAIRTVARVGYKLVAET